MDPWGKKATLTFVASQFNPLHERYIGPFSHNILKFEWNLSLCYDTVCFDFCICGGWCVCVCVYCAMQYVIIMRCFSLIVPPVSAMIAWQREWGTWLSVRTLPGKIVIEECCRNGVHIAFCFQKGDFLPGVTPHICSLTMRGLWL